MTRAIKKKTRSDDEATPASPNHQKNPILPIHVSISIAKIAGAE
jgi:hypothetical protein